MAQLLEACYESAQMESRLREQDTPLNELERAIAQQQPDQFRSFIQSLVSPEVAVIAEHKRKSPGGKIYPEREIGEVVRQYQTGGALALSVLTEGEHFGGKLGDLHEARQATRLPVMRKDFIGTPYQLCEAKAHGADAVLLIAAGLVETTLASLYQEANDINLECLVETRNEREVERALAIGFGALAINNRQITTASRKVDLETTSRLRPLIPEGIVVVSKSGYSVEDTQQMQRLREVGVDAVLVGGSLLSANSPVEALRSWIGTI